MQPPDFQRTVAEIERELSHGRDVCVSGPTGSGRSTIAADLARSLDQQPILLEPPPAPSPDAADALLLGVRAALVGDRANFGPTFEADGRPSRQLTDLLWSHRHRPIIVRLRATQDLRLPGKAATVVWRRLSDALATLRIGRRPFVLVLDDELQHRFKGFGGKHVQLPEHDIEFSAEAWSGLRDSAAELRGHVEGMRSPLQWRLGVAAVHLGCNAEEVGRRFMADGRSLHWISDRIVERIGNDRDLLDATRRLLVLRTPLESDVASSYLNASAAHLPLLTEGLAYGNPLRVHPVVLGAIAAKLPEGGPEPEVHDAAASAYAQLDGSLDAERLGPTALTAWVEKLHHLARGTERARAEWDRHRVSSPAMYWARGIATSMAGDYLQAARVFQACVEVFPEDAYAHHYRAWNLEKAEAEPAVVRNSYAHAVELDPSNPWWNGRRVRNLITTGRWREARREWKEAIDRVDPDGLRRMNDDWLIENLHVHVINAWLTAGVWYEAAELLSTVPPTSRAVRANPDCARRLEGLRRDVVAFGDTERKRLTSFLADKASESPAWQRLQRWWTLALQHYPGLIPPAALDAEDGPLLEWSTTHIQLSLDFDPNGDGIEWSAFDSDTQQGDVGDTTLDPTPGEHHNDGVGAGLASWLGRLEAHVP